MFHEKNKTGLQLFRQPLSYFDEKLRKSPRAGRVTTHLFNVDSIDLSHHVDQDRAAVEVQRKLFHSFGHWNLTSKKKVSFKITFSVDMSLFVETVLEVDIVWHIFMLDINVAYLIEIETYRKMFKQLQSLNEFEPARQGVVILGDECAHDLK